jgi:hypothetical protein
MNTEEVARKVVELVRKQAWYEALDQLYDENIASVEGGAGDEKQGKEAVRGKIDWWVNAFEVHSFKAGEPFVAAIVSSCNTTPKSAIRRRRSGENSPRLAFIP